MNGADLLCDTLLANGIETCFANPGTSEMHFVAALDRKPRMRCVLGLSEGVVTGAADGYARMAEKPAATLLHLGPGFANGIANLHNARRARVPMLNIVGDHATYHLALDAPLTSDIESLARPVSGWVGRVQSSAELGGRALEAIAATRRGAAGQISTLILPADTAWTDVPDVVPRQVVYPTVGLPSDAAIRAAAEALRTPGAVLILGGDALRERATRIAGQISTVTGAILRADVSNRRIERGAGRVRIERIPYALDAALADLAQARHAVLVGARVPVAFFAYPGRPGYLLPEGCPITIAATPEDCAITTLQMLAEAVGVRHHTLPVIGELALPDRPSGPLTSQAIGQAVARHMPESGIYCDESLTSGPPSWALTHGSAPHDHIQITGGAIGSGMPLSTGAAIACPDRKVVALQADGSGAYTLQALWTQAREQLDVVTLVFANRRYQILLGELAQVGAGDPGENAMRMMSLEDPSLDWVHLARGFGCEAVSVSTAEALDDVLGDAMEHRGPRLIEMQMP